MFFGICLSYHRKDSNKKLDLSNIFAKILSFMSLAVGRVLCRFSTYYKSRSLFFEDLCCKKCDFDDIRLKKENL